MIKNFWAQVEGPKNFRDAGVPPPWDMDVADSVEICFSHLRYRAKFGHSTTTTTTTTTTTKVPIIVTLH